MDAKLPMLCHVPVAGFQNLGQAFQMPIYRYMPFDYLIGMIESGENVLVNPLAWEDQYEAAVAKVPSTWYDGTTVDVSVMGEELYAQCWSVDATESDFRWKSYRAEGGTVRIATTVQKLLESVEALFPDKDTMMMAALFGKVGYFSQEQLDHLLSCFSPMSNPLSVMWSLLFKRDVYKQEEEVRIVIRNGEMSGIDEFRENVSIEHPLMRMPLHNSKNFVTNVLLGTDISREQQELLAECLRTHGWTARTEVSRMNAVPTFKTPYS